MSYDKATRLAITGGIVLLASWVLAFAVVFTMPLVFPTMEAGTFFSASLVEVKKVDFIDLYIPINPFSSLARTVVPAAAVFSVAFGIALIGVEDKKTLFGILTAVSKTLTRIATMVVKITPTGVFAITSLVVSGATIIGTQYLLDVMVSKEDRQRQTLMHSLDDATKETVPQQMTSAADHSA